MATVIHLALRRASYVLRVTEHGHLELVHWGRRVGAPDGTLTDGDVAALATEQTHLPAMAVTYAASSPLSLDALPLAWSGWGKGDYREPPLEARMPDGTFVHDLIYVSHRRVEGVLPPTGGLPGAHAGDRTRGATTDPSEAAYTVVVTMRDAVGGLEADLVHTAYPALNALTRRTVLRTISPDGTARVRRVMSQMVDLPDVGYDLVTFDGTWINEGQRHTRPLAPGLFVNTSHTGDSSHRHNPGLLLATRGASEDHGGVYGFNLVYSGAHYTGVEVSSHGLVRVLSGINPVGFEWELAPGETFETPEALLTYSDRGFAGASADLHDFVTDHITRGPWAGRERPVKANTWEALWFDVREGQVRDMAKAAARLGVELFVLDDGWFGRRDDDTSSLGDWTPDPRKLPGGLRPLADEVRRRGMTFGIWVEPEGVSPDSDLYRAHPDWVVRTPGREPSLGRGQLRLDLTREDVRDHLVAAIGAVIDESAAGYVKWDMNRHLSDVGSAVHPAGEVMHRLVLGLYDVLDRVFTPRPHVLLETCSSGGNRFDLGMLCFGPQIWTSDNTDPIARLPIQDGLSHLYPPSTMGAHVAASPHAQTLRATPLSTRFNVAAFGVLGYELDPRRLTPAERREVRAQIRWYQAHRALLQHGRFRRLPGGGGHQVRWSASPRPGAPGPERHVVGDFRTTSSAAARVERLPVPPLRDDAAYTLTARPQGLDLGTFGGLLAHVLPRWVNPTGALVGVARRLYRLPDAAPAYRASGATLNAGVALPEPFVGQPRTDSTRMLGDHGSTLYVLQEVPA